MRQAAPPLAPFLAGPQPHPQLQHLRGWRKWRGYTQAELAQRAGIAVATVSKLENCRRTAKYVTVRKLAEALSITPERLLHKRPTPFDGFDGSRN